MKKKGQVWVETVIYTLIGLAVIGILLAVSKPKIDSMRDKLVIEQSVEALDLINDKIYEVQRAPGNRRVVELTLSKGRFIIDAANNQLSWVIESEYKYSEPDVVVPVGNIEVLTSTAGPWVVSLNTSYSVDLIADDDMSLETKELAATTNPYFLKIENLGRGPDGNFQILISEE